MKSNDTILGADTNETVRDEPAVEGVNPVEGAFLDGLDPAEASSLEEALARLLRAAGAGEDDLSKSSKDVEEDEDNWDDEDDEAEEENEDDEDDEDDEDSEEDEDGEEDGDPFFRPDIKVPIGQRVILRRDFRSNKAYCDTVVKYIQTTLRKQGIPVMARPIREDVKVFSFDRSNHGVDIDCHILCEYSICNIRIEFRLNVDNLPGRTPLIDFYCQEKNFPLRYGCVIMDHSDGEKKIEYSFSFLGAFSEEAFLRYWTALDTTLKVFAKDFATIASGKSLDREQRQIVRKLLNDLAANLPSRVKPENEEAYNRVVAAFGGTLSPKMKKLANYIVEHVK